MNLNLLIAKKYFFSRSKKTFIHAISIISMGVVGISTLSLIIILSVFNGLENLIKNLYGTFDPEIVVFPEKGKFFSFTDVMKQQLYEMEEIGSIAEIMEDNALVKYKDAQQIVKVKGVSHDFFNQNRLEKYIADQKPNLDFENFNFAIVGRGLQFELAVQLNDELPFLKFYYPNDIAPNQLNPSKLFTKKSLKPGCVFAVEKYYDEKYIFVPLAFTQELFGIDKGRTALEIKSRGAADTRNVINKIQNVLGSDFKVLSNIELHGSLYKILAWEKIFIFLTFSLIIAVGAINIYFSLSMLVLDKKKDLTLLRTLGLSKVQIKNIILIEGFFIAFVGGIIGLVLGTTLVWLQKTFGWVGIGLQNHVFQAYPVKIMGTDLFYIFIMITGITFLTAIHPAYRAAKTYEIKLLQ